MNTNEIQIYNNNINYTSYSIANLTPDTEYIIKTAAYTNSGKGPWSSEFKGQSLKLPKDEPHPFILWSTLDGVLKSDLTGDNYKTIVLQNLMKGQFCKDVSWYKDLIYIVTNASEVFLYNISSHEYSFLENIKLADSIVVDWIGKKIYWSNSGYQFVSIYF